MALGHPHVRTILHVITTFLTPPYLNPNLPRSLQYYQKGVLQPEAWFRIVEHDYTQLIAAIDWQKVFHKTGCRLFSCWILSVERDVFQKCSNPDYPQPFAFNTTILTLPIIVWPLASRLSNRRSSHEIAGKQLWNMPRRFSPLEPMT